MMVIKKAQRVYVDTSVISIPFNKDERSKQTIPFWNAVNNGVVQIIASDILKRELDDAPAAVQEFFDNLPKSQIEWVTASEQTDNLAEQYIAEGVVGKSSLDDCKHIAIATIANADYLVSWNFKHIVNVNRIRGYNSVNLKYGYKMIDIRTPYEVINDETND